MKARLKRPTAAGSPPAPIVRRYAATRWRPPRRPQAVGEVMRLEVPVAVRTAPIAEVRRTMEMHDLDLLPVADGEGRCLGVVHRSDLAPVEGARALDRLDPDVRRLSRDQPLTSAAAAFLAARTVALPVVSAGGRLEGLLFLRDVIDAAGARPRRSLLARSSAAVDKLIFAAGAALAITALSAASDDASGWICFFDVGLAGLALLCSALVRVPVRLGFVLVPFLSVSLTVLSLFCRALEVPGWFAWAHLAFALAMALLAALAAARRPGAGLANAGPIGA